MKNNIRLLASVIAGCGMIGASPLSYAGWYGGDCEDHQPNGDGDVCIEYREGSDYWHMRGSHQGTNKGQWLPIAPTPVVDVYSSAPMEDFTFSGTTNLSCFSGSVVATCALSLDGRVSLDGNKVGIDITNGRVTGSGVLCGLITVGGFPWGIGPDSQHAPAWDGITIDNDGPYVGSVGSISFSVKNPVLIPPYLVNISNAHIHQVKFDNNGTGPSHFKFNNDIVANSTDVSTGCAIDGTLTIVGDRDIDIFYYGL